MRGVLFVYAHLSTEAARKALRVHWFRYTVCMVFASRAIGWGIVIYAVIYLLWSGLVMYGLATGIASLVVRIACLALVTTIAARSLDFHNWRDLLPYSFAWAVVAALLDAVFLVPFSGVALYSSLGVWVGYSLVVVIPLLSPMRRSVHTRTGRAL